MKKLPEDMAGLVNAVESVIATANGNTYGLTVADQLEALRMAADYLNDEYKALKKKLESATPDELESMIQRVAFGATGRFLKFSEVLLVVHAVAGLNYSDAERVAVGSIGKDGVLVYELHRLAGECRKECEA